MFGFGIETPGLAPYIKDFFRDSIKSSAPSLSEKQSNKISDLFQNLLSSGADPSRVAFESSILGQMYPGEKTFQPGGSIFNELLKERLSPESKKETIADANYLTQTILGRPMTQDEESYIKDTRDLDAFTGLLYSSPEATLAAFPTSEEDKISAYYGRMIPGKGGFTGMRFSNIEPVEYTGGFG